jgi:hypothetical protein
MMESARKVDACEAAVQACASLLYEGQCQFPYLCAHALLQVESAMN